MTTLKDKLAKRKQGKPFLATKNFLDYTPEQYDAVLAYSIKKSDIEDARSLFATKWWDYRFEHPGKCFYEFAYLYGQAAERWRTMFGVNPYVKMRHSQNPIFLIEKDDLGKAKVYETPQTYRTGLWRSMCSADALGVPYDRWVEWAFAHAFASQWARFPHPVSFSSDRIVTHEAERWELEKRDLLATPKDPRYLIENYEGHPWQDEFQDWLLGYIAARPAPHIPLAYYLSEEPLILLDRATKRLGEHTVSQAIQRI